MKTITVESPQKRKNCNFSSWCRVVDKDGSTIAYVPDHATAITIVEVLTDDPRDWDAT